MKILPPQFHPTQFQPRIHRRSVLGACLIFASPWATSLVQAQIPTFVDETWQDPRRQRAIPVRIRWPQGAAPAAGWPLVIYSHGLGGSRTGGNVWGEAWAAAGMVVVHLQHTGSDIDAVRATAGSFRDGAALRKLGSAEQLLARLADVKFALDESARRETIDKAWRAVRVDAAGLAGHSFGAHTTLGAGGQSYPGYPAYSELAGMKDERIAALIALSPTVPNRGDARLAMAGITRPTLCITGTLDGDVVGNGATPDKRAAVFAALPDGNKALLLLKDADHMTFGGLSDASGRAAGILPREAVTTQLQAQHHALVARVTTDWWLAHLVGPGQSMGPVAQPAGLGGQDV